jgi:hypothetical protein
MKVIGVKDVEDCFDRLLIKEIRVDAPLCKSTVLRLGEGGTVNYFEEFPRPFFKVRVSGCFDIKGIAGNKHFSVHLKDPRKFSLDRFIGFVEASVE